MRFAKNSAPYLVIINVGDDPAGRDFTPSAGVQYGKVTLHVKPSAHGKGTAGLYIEGKTVDLERIMLQPGEGVVLMLMLDMVLM